MNYTYHGENGVYFGECGVYPGEDGEYLSGVWFDVFV